MSPNMRLPRAIGVIQAALCNLPILHPAPEGAINHFVIANTAPQVNLFHREQPKSPGFGMVRITR